jgi:hypothetical protein
MSSPNANWDRWIFASISKHFVDVLSSNHVFIEGQKRDTRKLTEWFEVRVDGPFYTETSKGMFDVLVEINILCASILKDESIHNIHSLTGLVANAMTTSLVVYKYGTGVLDDQSVLGCLKIVTESRGKDRIQTNHFGQIGSNTELIQATVEGHYKMELEA